jgi:hypothetical protein
MNFARHEAIRTSVRAPLGSAVHGKCWLRALRVLADMPGPKEKSRYGGAGPAPAGRRRLSRRRGAPGTWPDATDPRPGLQPGRRDWSPRGRRAPRASAAVRAPISASGGLPRAGGQDRLGRSHPPEVFLAPSQPPGVGHLGPGARHLGRVAGGHDRPPFGEAAVDALGRCHAAHLVHTGWPGPRRSRGMSGCAARLVRSVARLLTGRRARPPP